MVRRLMLFLVLGSQCYAQKADKALDWLLAGSVGVFGAGASYDAYTSSNFPPGVRETNPLTRNAAGGYSTTKGVVLKSAVFGVVVGAEYLGLRWFKRHGEPGDARIVKATGAGLNITGGIIYGLAGRHNANLH